MSPVLPSGLADRNLLVGILALQMNFVSRDQLIAGMQSWVFNKDRPLGQILLDQGALPTDTYALLDALVQKHLELHGNDAQKSLAAVSSVGSVREELKQLADPDLQASLVHVSAACQPDDDPWGTKAPSVGTSTSSGLRFRILRPYLKGGLGQLSVALDEELHREVALKEIQDKHADHPESRSRFVLEAEITGGLEHPGIVPVYGLGTYADGRPFYAMRFIRGHSLQDAVTRFHQAEVPGRDPSERSLELRKLLGRFVDVCNAIAYAHSRGVLHRDLKPGNVMLGKYGETLVVDWGLAKPLGRSEGSSTSEEGPLRPASASDSAPTQMGSAVGTPRYMSPEQAAGRLDELGPASDVYSLGATLYCLLTGKAPLQDARADVGAILQAVQRGEIPRPRQVKPHVHPALEAICLKAMALRPSDRYVSPRGLADDIEHWLADETILAYREPVRLRLARWGRRHRTLVTSGAVLLVTMTVVSLGAVILIEQHRRAEQHFKEALAAADLLTKVAQEWLGDLPEMEQGQQDLLEKALHMRKQLLKEHPRDPQMRKELALANHRVGNIWKMLRKPLEAEEPYRQAIGLFDQLIAEFPKESEYQHNLAISHNDLGEVLRVTSSSPPDAHLRDAEAHYRQALSLQRRLVKEHGSSLEYRQELARTHNNLGILLEETGRPQEADQEYEEAIVGLQGLSAEQPGKPAYQADLGRACINRGHVLEAKEPRQAEALYRRAIALFEHLKANFPTKHDYEYKRATAYNNLGNLLASKSQNLPAQVRDGMVLRTFDPCQLGAAVDMVRLRALPLQEAEKTLRASRDLFTRLVIDFSKHHLYKKELANSYNSLGNVLWLAGQLRQAEQVWLEARSAFKDLVTDCPDVHEYKSLLGITLANLGWLALSRAEAGQTGRCLLLAVPGSPQCLGLTLASAGWLLCDRKDLVEAREFMQQAIDQQGAALQRNPQNPQYRARLTNHYQTLARIQADLGNPAGAAAAKAEAERLRPSARSQ